MSALKKYMDKNGHEAKAEKPKKRVATVAVMHGDHLLMGKRRDNGKWTTPGGHAEGDEELHDAAVRELEEESGIKAHHSHVTPLAEAKTVHTEKGDSIQVQPFVHEVAERPNTSMKRDPDAEVERWTWVDTSKGLPDDIKNNLHVPMERNALLPCLGLGDDEMKGCGELEKYMKKKGTKMNPNKRHNPEKAHDGIATDKYDSKQADDDDIYDHEGAKSKKAARGSKHYQKMG